MPGDIVIMRAYTFTNYAGRFLYVEAHNKDAHRHHRPGDVVVVRRRRRRVPQRVTSTEQQQHQPRRRRRGRSAATRSSTATPAQAPVHVPPRAGRPARRRREPGGARPRRSRSRVAATRTGNIDTSGVIEWAGEALPPRVAELPEGLHHEVHGPDRDLRPDGPARRRSSRTSCRRSSCPNKTDGYQRPGMAMMAGTTAANANPNAANTPFAVQLFSKAMGHLGGNNITAEFKAPAAGTLNAPLSITVTDGTWRDPRPRRRGRQQRHQRDHGPDQGHRRQPRHRRHRRADHHGRAGRRRDQRRSGRERAGDGVHVRRQRGRGHRPGDAVARTYQVPDGTTNGPATSRRQHQGQAVGLPARRHGLLGRQLPRGHPADARPHGRAPRPEGPVHAEGVPDRQGPLATTRSASSSTASSTPVSGSPASPASRPPSGSCATTRRTRRPRSTSTSSTSSSCRSANPDGGHYAFHDNSVQRKNMKNYCPVTADARGGIGNRNSWGVDLNRNNTVGTLFDGYAGASTSLHRARPSPARRRPPRPRSRTSTGSATRSRASSSRTTSTRTAATSCGRRARTSRRAA